MYNWFIDFINNLLYSGQGIYNWLVNPFITLGGVSLSPLLLISASGLITYLGVAIVKWFL